MFDLDLVHLWTSDHHRCWLARRQIVFMGKHIILHWSWLHAVEAPPPCNQKQAVDLHGKFGYDAMEHPKIRAEFS